MRPPLLRYLVAVNALLVVCAMASGATLAVSEGRRVVLPSPRPLVSDIRESTIEIVRLNGRVWLFVCAGVASLGVAGTTVVIANAFRFGMDAAAVGLSYSGELRFLAAHGALEFAAFTLAAASVQYIGSMLFALLVHSERYGRLPIGLAGLAGSAGLVVLAAWAEALSRALRATGGA